MADGFLIHVKVSLKFQCQPNCGKCCSADWNNSQFVFLTEADMVRLEKHLGTPRTEWAREAKFDFTRKSKTPSWEWFLNFEKKCQWLTLSGKCSVYEARPTQCRTFPFWPEHMNPKAWEVLKESCPGIGVGPELDDDMVGFEVAKQVMADNQNLRSG